MSSAVSTTVGTARSFRHLLVVADTGAKRRVLHADGTVRDRVRDDHGWRTASDRRAGPFLRFRYRKEFAALSRRAEQP